VKEHLCSLSAVLVLYKLHQYIHAILVALEVLFLQAYMNVFKLRTAKSSLVLVSGIKQRVPQITVIRSNLVKQLSKPLPTGIMSSRLSLKALAWIS
jgi:hypothetical protein